MNDAYVEYLNSAMEFRTSQIETTSKMLSPKHSVVVAMRCELNMLKEVKAKYSMFKNEPEVTLITEIPEDQGGAANP